jgi:dipeptidyl aminopeptidase/acylaminoacyl peptidase
MVLQVDELDNDRGTPQELENELTTFDSAIELLNDRGIIDPARVGLVGFSRTCLHVKYALTHSKYHFAAAVVSDGVDGGYFQYLLMANSSLPGLAAFSEGIYGARPFGSGLKAWMGHSPGFNIDRVETPLRIDALNPATALSEWEWFAALSRLGKPVEMVMMQDGLHALEKPWERRISLQGNVDWFCFWLKGEEDGDPAKAEQYLRWRKMREVRQHWRDNREAEPAN